jgi:riboflavin synthase alpha subunit
MGVKRLYNVEKVVVNGDWLTAYITRSHTNFEEKIVRKGKLENLLEFWKEHNKALYNWCKQQGFIKVLHGWSGYHYGKKHTGDWYEIDAIKNEVYRYIGKKLDKQYFLSLVISEDEWGPWVKNVKFVLKKHP